MRSLRAPVLVVASLALVVTACSGSGGPAPTGTAAATGLVPIGTNAPVATQATGGSGGGGAPAIPCDKLAPLVTQITGLPIASVDASPDDCSFSLNPPGDSSSNGFGGIVDIRRESTGPQDFDEIARIFTGTDGVDVPGVGDRARRNKSGSLMYAVHNGHVWAVQQELLVTSTDLAGNAGKLMQALFQFV